MPPGRTKSGKPTMQDIADQLGVSKVSVFKALSGQKGVSEELRQRIFQEAQKLGYTRTTAENTFHFAFVVSKHFFLETDAFYSEMYYYFNKQCIQKGHSTTLIIVNGPDEARGILPVQLQKDSFHGIAVAGEMSDQYLQLLAELKLPMVLMDFENYQSDMNAILTDNFHWGFRVTQYLIRHGHKKIGFVGQPGATNSITDRYLGYRKALMLHQLPYQDEWLIVNNDTRSGLYRSNITLPKDMPTAFVCHCDMAANYLMGALELNDLRCPQDVSLISFDNTKLAEATQPPLTSVNIDTRSIAQQAQDTLLEILAGRQKGSTRVYIPAGLIERQSVCAPKDHAEA